MNHAVDVNNATKKTAPFAAWLVAYVVIGGAVFLLAGILRRTALGDLPAISLSVLMAVVLGWLTASWVQRRVASRVEASEAHGPST